jgi:hypothetical protein
MRPKVLAPIRHALPIVLGLTALAPLTSRGAFAQTIPSYGTNAHCQRLAAFGGAFSRSVYGSCLNVEQSAALALQGRWSSIPESVRERCDRLAGGPPTRSCRTAWMWNWLRQQHLAPRRRRYCAVLSSDVGGRTGNAV